MVSEGKKRTSPRGPSNGGVRACVAAHLWGIEDLRSKVPHATTLHALRPDSAPSRGPRV